MNRSFGTDEETHSPLSHRITRRAALKTGAAFATVGLPLAAAAQEPKRQVWEGYTDQLSYAPGDEVQRGRRRRWCLGDRRRSAACGVALPLVRATPQAAAGPPPPFPQLAHPIRAGLIGFSLVPGHPSGYDARQFFRRAGSDGTASMRNRLLLVLAVTLAGLAGLWTGGLRTAGPQPKPRVKESPPVVVVESQSLGVGEVWEDREFQRTVRVVNQGADTVRIDDVGCGCKGPCAAPSQFELAPGTSREVRVTLDLSLPFRPGPEPVPFTTPVRVRWTAPSGSGKPGHSEGALRGAVKPVLITRPVWNLGLHSKASGPIDKTVQVVAATPLATLDMEFLPNPHWTPTISMMPRGDQPGTLDMRVRSGAPTTAGILRSEVVLKPTAATGEVLPPKRVTIEAEVAEHDTRLNPSELVFGGAKVGETVESRVVVTSISGREIRIDEVKPDGADLQVTPGDSPNEYRVKQRVTRPGPASGTVWFTARTKDGIERIGLPVQVIGVASSGQ